ncbi:substrate-binding periplasmic protein [Alteromonas sp. CYL-A6]|uniref:substrate-binding periplasmic protein n=1 Tax=Alteromonas nitratireducens TaxID=3390813 RepID=UPI0034B4CEDA
MRVVTLFLVLMSFAVSATDKPLRVAVNIGPPWAFYDEDRGVVGIDVDIIRTVLSRLGHSSEFYLLAYNRLINDFNAGKYDIASPAAFPSDIGHLTQRYLPFKDVAVSLTARQLTIDNVNDLAGKKVIAYQSATQVLGSDYAAAVSQANYLEVAEREVQLTLLVSGRTDIVIGEQRLLTFIMENQYPEQAMTVHPIFETRSYGAIFKDATLQQQFDLELEKMRASGEFDAIMSEWH